MDAGAGKRFCGECGASLVDTTAPTATSVPSQIPTLPQTSSNSRDPSSGPRFLPGAMFSERYRIVGLLGRGGMGEVYRADDLKLGQPVALKLLPREFEGDSARLDRFLNEVRLALKVTHPNVCRVFDIGEVDGRHFLSMEYVDGEDLASLLRRIGRLPEDKAVQVARQICAGLAAAHDQGVLHRDLKPANVMIDGRGRAKITDFGLAGATSGIRGAEARAGTPAYMAPEQLAGEELTERTDIYALGLVLYELFTGKPVFSAGSIAEMVRLQRETTPASLASQVDNLDPAVERGIRRCLETDPAGRPASALTVAAGLPGGDPLAAALAAGETPSPAMVAEAGSEGGLRPVIAVALLVPILLGMVAIAFLGVRNRLPHKIPLPKPPAELAVEARKIIEASGWTDPPADRAFGFGRHQDYFDWVEDNDSSADRWAGLNSVRPSPVFFWYRQSASYLVTRTGGHVRPSRPPIDEPGMINLNLDPDGRLQWFQAIGPDGDDSEEPETAMDWAPFFELAGLGPDSFEPTPFVGNPRLGMDTRRAWTGHYPENAVGVVRVEAGSFRGRPVYFKVVPEWARPQLTVPTAPPLSETAPGMIVGGIEVLLFFGAVLLAWRNNRQGRGDRRGAFRLAMFLFVVELLKSILRTHHVPTLGELHLMTESLATALFRGAIIWLFYMAAEPYIRRLWPDTLIAWTRLLDGRFKDPLLGRHLLIGALAGIGLSFYFSSFGQIRGWLGIPPNAGEIHGLYFPGVSYAVSNYLEVIAEAFVVPVAMLLIILLLRVLLRRQWLAITVLLALVFALGFARFPDYGLAGGVFMVGF
ncbi:MAG: serine/threonine-protein kinase, partial [Thermoanaerobaculia bacterium]